jgi:hypothetical protein
VGFEYQFPQLHPSFAWYSRRISVQDYQPDVSPFRIEVAKRIPALNQAGVPADWAVPVGDRARIRTEVGREFFRRRARQATSRCSGAGGCNRQVFPTADPGGRRV